MSSGAVRSGATFVLVHGAWHGGWCWRRVHRRLTARGHRVFAPTLTGLGERRHLLNADVDLNTHITDVLNLLHYESLDDIVLVAHSYGSWVASGVLEHTAAVRSVVFIDCYLPHDGELLRDHGTPAAKRDIEDALAAGRLARPAPPAEYFGVRSDADRAWVGALLTPQPVGVSLTPIHLTGARDKIPSKTYVRAPRYESRRFDEVWDALAGDPSWVRHRVPGGHDVMIDEPDRLVEILDQSAAVPDHASKEVTG